MQIFVRGLGEENLGRHVALQAPETLNEAIRHACAYNAMPVRTPRNEISKPKHVSSVETAQTSVTDRLVTQLAEMCNQQRKIISLLEAKSPKRAEIVCYNCNEKGHMSRGCPRRGPDNRRMGMNPVGGNVPGNASVVPATASAQVYTGGNLGMNLN